ncbi:MAG: cyclase family protein [Cyanobacteria bacterium]|nr:cyclase family protein [Cyanobacteriota bacterium]
MKTTLVGQLLGQQFELIDISQPVHSKTAAFPGDTPFSKTETLTYSDSGVINLSAFTMSPHIGTHADAPVHIQGSLGQAETPHAGDLGLTNYMGPCLVIDCIPSGKTHTHECLNTISTGIADICRVWEKQVDGEKPVRILLKTRTVSQPEVFAGDYASISPELADWFGEQGGLLVGIDTPSVDPVDSKTLPAHHAMLKHGIVWLENLDLSAVEAGRYDLIALPLNMTELEASPVRAVLIKKAN